MKKIRTILAYYNGEKFVDEQLQSIVNQDIPEGYEHEIIVVDDGSRSESKQHLLSKWGKVVKIKSQKNRGVFLTFLSEFANAIDEKIDVVFFADQDDVYSTNKYKLHIKEHENGNVYVSSRAREWYWENNEYRSMRLNLWSGHRMSIAAAHVKINTNKFREEIKRISQTKYVKRYHDTFLGYWFAMVGSVKFVDEILTDYRVNTLSVSRSIDKETRKIWRDNYGYYFVILKPFWENVYNKKLSIRDFNKGLYIYDENYFGRRFLSYMRVKWNNVWMYLKVKKMRNM